jgi:hypothetical protein
MIATKRHEHAIGDEKKRYANRQPFDVCSVHKRLGDANRRLLRAARGCQACLNSKRARLVSRSSA